MSTIIPEILFCKETSNSIAKCVLLAQAISFYSSSPSPHPLDLYHYYDLELVSIATIQSLGLGP